MVIFDGRDISVVGRLFDSCTDRLVITFTGRAAAPPVKAGFGENYLLKRQISAVHFISKDNHWWQTPEPQRAIDELEHLGLLSGRVLTLYGSSMGGYAALMLSGRLKPQRVILFSPQYSIDAKRVPFEARWRNYAAKLSFDYDDMAAGIDHATEIKAVFDPFYQPDTRHIEMIERLRPLDRIAVPFAGHNTARTLEELGTVTRVTDSLLAGVFDLFSFRRSYREQRPASSLFWYGFAETLERRGHEAYGQLSALIAAQIMSRSGRMKDPVLRRDLMRRAIPAACAQGRIGLAQTWLAAIEPLEKHRHQWLYLRAQIARAEDQWSQVLSDCETALTDNGETPAYRALKLEAQIALGRSAEVLAWCDAHPLAAKRSGPILLAQAAAYAGTGQWQTALDTLRFVFRFDRRLPAGRVLASQCWAALGRPEAAEKQLLPVLGYELGDGRLAVTIGQLLLDGGARAAAKRFNTRHQAFQLLADSVLAALDELDWSRWPAQLPALRHRFLR